MFYLGLGEVDFSGLCEQKHKCVKIPRLL